jgi:hypothetical protein
MDNPKCTVIFSRRLLLIQSYKQLAYVITIVLTINIVVDVTLPFHSIFSYVGTAVASSLSIAIYLWRIFPHEMIVHNSEISSAQDEIEANLSKIMKEVSGTPTTIMYKENLPDFLTWDEARVSATLHPEATKIVGSGITLSWLRRRLERIDKKKKEPHQGH